MAKPLLTYILTFTLARFCFAAPATTTKGFNPDISANFLLHYQQGNHVSTNHSSNPRKGFYIKETELQLSADVDPYFRGVSLFSIAQENGSSEYKIEPEELYIETLSLPVVTFKAGKFKMAMGKHNQLHTHAYPFIDSPLINQELLGEEGLNEIGLSAAALFPLPWFSEITLQTFQASNGSLFLSEVSNDSAGLIHLKNLFDLSSDWTMEMGASASAGKNQYIQTTYVFGGDLTFKWRPAQGGKYQSFVFSTEYLQGDRKGKLDDSATVSNEKLGGLATWIQYQFAERWWAEGRYEILGLARTDEATQPKKNKQSALIAFLPSEFSALRFQYDHISTENISEDDHVFTLQINISIGAHPAHAY